MFFKSEGPAPTSSELLANSINQFTKLQSELSDVIELCTNNIEHTEQQIEELNQVKLNEAATKDRADNILNNIKSLLS